MTKEEFAEWKLAFDKEQAERDAAHAEWKKVSDKELAELRAISEKLSVELKASLKETSDQIKATKTDIVGISNSNGLVAEDYFYNYFDRTLTFGNMNFETVVKGDQRSRKMPNGERIKGQWDILLINGESIAVIEVKYKAEKSDVVKLAENDPEKIRKIYKEFENHKLYLGIAGLSMDKGTETEALTRGIAVLKQNGNVIEMLDGNLRTF